MEIICLAQSQDEQLLGTTQVIIDPQLQSRIQQAIDDIRQTNPDVLKDITHIYALHGKSNFGEWRSDDPHAIFLNMDRLEQEVERQLKQGLPAEVIQSDVVKQEIERAIREQTGKVMVHEHAHVVNPEGGEPFAEQREQAYKLKGGLRSLVKVADSSSWEKEEDALEQEEFLKSLWEMEDEDNEKDDEEGTFDEDAFIEQYLEKMKDPRFFEKEQKKLEQKKDLGVPQIYSPGEQRDNEAFWADLLLTVQEDSILPSGVVGRLWQNPFVRAQMRDNIDVQRYWVQHYLEGDYDQIDPKWEIVQDNPQLQRAMADHALQDVKAAEQLDPRWPVTRELFENNQEAFLKGVRSLVTTPFDNRSNNLPLIGKDGAVTDAFVAFDYARFFDTENIMQYVQQFADEGSGAPEKGQEDYSTLRKQLLRARRVPVTQEMQGAIFDLYGASLISKMEQLGSEEARIVDFVEKQSAQQVQQFLIKGLEEELAVEILMTRVPRKMDYELYDNAEFVQRQLAPFYNQQGILVFEDDLFMDLAVQQEAIEAKTGVSLEQSNRWYGPDEEDPFEEIKRIQTFFELRAQGKEEDENPPPQVLIDRVQKAASPQQLAWMFALPDWERLYGGPLWAKVALYTVELRRATTSVDILRAVDKIMHLVHNTGSILDKPAFDAIGFQYRAIIEAKANPRSMRLMLPYMSPELQEIASQYLRAKMVAKYRLRQLIANRHVSAVKNIVAPNRRRYASRERGHLQTILSRLGYVIHNDGSITYTQEPVRKAFPNIFDAIDHEHQVIFNNSALVERNKENAATDLIQRKEELITLAKRRLNALRLWSKTFGQPYPLPGYVVTDNGDGNYTVLKEQDGTSYTVDINDQSCSCPGGQRGTRCKHLKAVLWKTT